MKGLVFSIEEFAVYDGPGIRTTVFLKGCPLRCNWCHNPEGLSALPQIVKSPNGCTDCGSCRAACKRGDAPCSLCGACVEACPKGLLRIAGETWESEALAARLFKNERMLAAGGGGVSFSGGECLLQADFLCETLRLLRGRLHTAIQTSGFAVGEVFDRVLQTVDLVLYDLKIIDSAAAKRFTGQDSAPILRNFRTLQESGVPYIVRVPLIPGVTDTQENMRDILRCVAENTAGLQAIELLPYNKLAGSKYALVGREYKPLFDTEAQPQVRDALFKQYGLHYRVL